VTNPLAETSAPLRDGHAPATTPAPPHGAAPPPGAKRHHLSAALQVIAALAVALGVLAFLVFGGNHGTSP